MPHRDMALVPSDRDVSTVLVVTAHPDDVDFGSGGTVATWTDAGMAVSYCVVTDGDAGGFDVEVARSEIPAIRQREQRRAAEAVGVSDLHFLGYPDGRLVASIELRRDISRIIRTVRPDRVLCQSPERNWQRIFASHPDHLAAAEAAICAVYPDARNPFAHPELAAEGLEAHTVGEVWVMGGMLGDETSGRVVDITDAFDRKIAALRAHESQHTDPAGMEQRVRAWNTAIALAAGLPEGRLAEGFAVVGTGG